MHEKIRQNLDCIETGYRVKILYACESGSRAWGFHSKDSDYDVRFIYVRNLDWYLSVNEKRNVLDCHDGLVMQNGIDASGWDLKKALQLLKQANPVLLEWLRSPIVYRDENSFGSTLQQLGDDCFSVKAGMYHYLNMAEGNFRKYLQVDRVQAKRYFYPLRTLLCCKYIERFKTPPPMLFQELVQAFQSDLKPDVVQAILGLLERKLAGMELASEPKISILNEFIDRSIHYFRALVKTLPSTSQSCDKIDPFFRAVLLQRSTPKK